MIGCSNVTSDSAVPLFDRESSRGIGRAQPTVVSSTWVRRVWNDGNGRNCHCWARHCDRQKAGADQTRTTRRMCNKDQSKQRMGVVSDLVRGGARFQRPVNRVVSAAVGARGAGECCPQTSSDIQDDHEIATIREDHLDATVTIGGKVVCHDETRKSWRGCRPRLRSRSSRDGRESARNRLGDCPCTRTQGLSGARIDLASGGYRFRDRSRDLDLCSATSPLRVMLGEQG